MSDHMMKTLWLIAGAGRGEVDDIAAMKSSKWAAEEIARLTADLDTAIKERNAYLDRLTDLRSEVVRLQAVVDAARDVYAHRGDYEPADTASDAILSFLGASLRTLDGEP